MEVPHMKIRLAVAVMVLGMVAAVDASRIATLLVLLPAVTLAAVVLIRDTDAEDDWDDSLARVQAWDRSTGCSEQEAS